MYKNTPARDQNRMAYLIEPIGIIPRSILKTLNRFFTQMFPNSNRLVVQEFRVSRYQVLVSIRCLGYLIFLPLLTNIFSNTFIFAPLTQYIWNTQHEGIFLNSYLEKEALSEFDDFEQQLYFDYLINPKNYENPIFINETNLQEGLSSNSKFHIAENLIEELKYLPDPKNSKIDLEKETINTPTFFSGSIEFKIQKKTIELTTYYNQRSIDSLTNFFVDLSTFWVFSLLLINLKTDIIILKSFLLESIYSLSDTTKSFLLILSTDLLVGFHSPRGWELFLDSVLNHFGLPHNESFIFLFVATFPVLLDTFFKYWIFRYLSRISPSTVVTYHAMIE